MNIGEIISKKGSTLHTMGHDQSFSVALRLMHETRIGCVIVMQTETKQMLGMVSQMELLEGFNIFGASALEHCVTGIMRKPVPTCHILDNAPTVMTYMTAERTRHVVARDETGAVCGIVSIGDVVAAQLIESKIEADILRDMARSRMLAA